MAAQRRKIKYSKARKTFKRTANRTNKKNITSTRPKRGGYRL